MIVVSGSQLAPVAQVSPDEINDKAIQSRIGTPSIHNSDTVDTEFLGTANDNTVHYTNVPASQASKEQNLGQPSRPDTVKT